MRNHSSRSPSRPTHEVTGDIDPDDLIVSDAMADAAIDDIIDRDDTASALISLFAQARREELRFIVASAYRSMVIEKALAEASRDQSNSAASSTSP